MKTTTILIAALLGLMSFSACKKYLDVKPKGYVIPQTVEDLERLLNGQNMTRMLPTDLDMLSDDFLYKDADKASLLRENSTQSRIYLWLPEIYNTPEDWKYNSAWNLMYNNIYQYNAILNNIDMADGGTPQRKAAIRAQAKLGRAWCYWYLVNLYGKPFNAATAASDPGVPWITTNDIALPVPGRSNIKTTYDLINADLENAVKELPTSAVSPYVLTRGAGFGLFARVMLMQENYPAARKMADSALKYNSRLIDYNKVYKIQDARYVPIDNPPFADMTTSPENIHVQQYTYSGGLSGQYISPATVKMFEPHDLRNIFIGVDTATNEATGKLDTNYQYNKSRFYYANISVTTPEMYLIRAEASIRMGNAAAGMADINLLRKNRILASSYTPLSLTDTQQAMKVLLSERRKELLFHGARWFDMRRFNNDPIFGFTAHHYLKDGSTIDLPPNSNRYTLLIPPAALTENITQNP
ncbi:SusD family protein [Chitinophaga eiseniae]|uniref:SusD family protein n=1 Tax=Chitinophaga eiseniae TaxID=634771 RepID=A0A1T4TBN2_9BACT|nr:RagB/SusD family nutrient uptake outer membrane protein [Chitinophaga eiseniae]SKA37629.1 SusD family protein [Chitinophaga eiseniae]